MKRWMAEIAYPTEMRPASSSLRRSAICKASLKWDRTGMRSSRS